MNFVTNADVVRWHDALLRVIDRHRPRKRRCTACDMPYPCPETQVIAVWLEVLSPTQL